MLDRAISLFGVVDLCHGFFHGADIGIVAVHYFIGKSLAFVKNVVRLEYGFGAPPTYLRRKRLLSRLLS